MSKEEKRTKRQVNPSKTFNGWKWAFIGLTLLIIFFFIYLLLMFQPVPTHSSSKNDIDNATPKEENMITLTTSIHTEDVEWLMNTYLEEAVGEDYSNYRVALTNQFELHGEVEFLGFDIPFVLYFDPYVLENGNIQLRGDAVEVGRFSLPIQTVMRLFANQAEIPEFVGFDTEQEMIYVYLNRLFEEYSFDLRLQKIDLEADDIQIDLYLNEDSTIENIELLEETNF